MSSVGVRRRSRSRNRAALPAYCAELIGTFLLVFFICGFISVSSAGGFDLAGPRARARVRAGGR